MPKRLTVIQGHPDRAGGHLGHALARHYMLAAGAAGHEVRLIEIAKIDFPLLHSQREWETGYLPGDLSEAQEAIAWAQHLVIFFPLWLGTMPALLKAFLEQVLRPGFAFDRKTPEDPWRASLSGKSARLVVTMGMPAPLYRWYYFAHGLRGMEREILGFCGIGPIKETLFGMVETTTKRAKWLRKLEALGRAGD
jgi:putative NADPH-quinone reductase